MTPLEGTSQKRKTAAEEALSKADTASMKRLYEEAENDVKTLAEGLGAMCRVGELKPRQQESGASVEAIQAIKEIALAAIDLAKQVSSVRGPQRDEKGHFIKPSTEAARAKAAEGK